MIKLDYTSPKRSIKQIRSFSSQWAIEASTWLLSWQHCLPAKTLHPPRILVPHTLPLHAWIPNNKHMRRFPGYYVDVDARRKAHFIVAPDKLRICVSTAVRQTYGLIIKVSDTSLAPFQLFSQVFNFFTNCIRIIVHWFVFCHFAMYFCAVWWRMCVGYFLFRGWFNLCLFATSRVLVVAGSVEIGVRRCDGFSGWTFGWCSMG
jgi:hypothetical protein